MKATLPPQTKTKIAAVLIASIGAAMGLSTAGRPASPITGPDASAPVPAEAAGTTGDPGWTQVLAGFLLPVPPDYVETPQVAVKPQFPVALTPAERDCLLFPYSRQHTGHTMGWTQADRDYIDSIPVEAKSIPKELSGLPALRFNNLEIHGEREVRWRSHGDWDQWFLRDATRRLQALMTIHRETRRVYFLEYLQEGPKLIVRTSQESCHACHASGARTIRTYQLPKVDPDLLGRANARLLSYGAADFGASIDPSRLGPALDDARCTGCHNGRTRGRLYAIHLAEMRYYLKTLHAMPPGRPLPEGEADALLGRVYTRWREMSGRG